MQAAIPAAGLPFLITPEVIFTNWCETLHSSGLTPGMQSVFAARELRVEGVGRQAMLEPGSS